MGALSMNYAEKATKITREEALKLGEARKIEALQRRENQLKAQAMKETVSSYSQSSMKTEIHGQFSQHGVISDAKFDDSTNLNIATFSLKKEEGVGVTPKPENNPTAISYQQFIQKKEGQMKTKTTQNVMDNVKEQVVFAKEFSPVNRQHAK